MMFVMYLIVIVLVYIFLFWINLFLEEYLLKINTSNAKVAYFTLMQVMVIATFGFFENFL